jgi:hypothetical protein
VRRRKMAIHKKGVARFVIVVILAVIALGVSAAPAYAGVSPEVGRTLSDNDYAIIGETNLVFVDSSGMPIPAGTLKGDWDYSIPISFPNAGDVFDSSKEDELVAGTYNVIGDNGNITRVNFREPLLGITPEVNDVEFNWATRGGMINLYTETNLEYIEGPKPNNISIKLSDPRGVRIYEVNTIRLSDISVDSNGDSDLWINTTGMRTGTYTLSIETDPETNNGLDEDGPEISFEVRARGVRIIEPEQDERTITVTEAKKLAIESTPRTNIALEITWGMPSSVSFKVNEDATEIISGGRTDDDGELELYAFFEVTGTFEITATEDIMGTSESVFIESVPYVAEITKPSTEINYIGVPIEIRGTATAGDTVTIKIDDETFAVVERDGDSFEAPEKWETKDKSPDSYIIEIWVSPFSDPETDAPDDSKTIILLRGGLFVEPSVPFVALGDEFTVTGIVPGRDRVDILTIGPDGGSGQGLDPLDIVEDTEGALDATGLTYETSGVDTDGEFETEKIAVNKDSDLGTYTIIALNYGRDGEWGRSGESNLLSAISTDYATPLGVKPTDQLMAIVEDRTIDVPGTDDLLGLTTIKVERGFVTVDALADAPLGGDVTVTGTTNREVDTTFTVTIVGTDERTPDLKPKIAKVKANDKIYYNDFEVTFATTSANIGEYIVTVNDGDGHTDSTTLTIVQAVEPAVNVSVTRPPESEGAEVNESAAKTPEPTPMTQPTNPPSEPPATESTAAGPGFLSLGIILVILWFVIAIIIAVWVYRDATEHGQNGVLWMIIVLILSVIGLLVWLVKRKSFGQLAKRRKK